MKTNILPLALSLWTLQPCVLDHFLHFGFWVLPSSTWGLLLALHKDHSWTMYGARDQTHDGYAQGKHLASVLSLGLLPPFNLLYIIGGFIRNLNFLRLYVVT